MILDKELQDIANQIQLTAIQQIARQATIFGGSYLTKIENFIKELLYSNISNQQNSLYYTIALGVKNIIVKWKEQNFESLPKFCSIWISYNSLLVGDNGKRVVPIFDSKAYSYRYNGSNFNLVSEAIEIWFYKFLSSKELDSRLNLSQNEYFPPSIHNYLVLRSRESDSLPQAISICHYDKHNAESHVLAKDLNQIVFVKLEDTHINNIEQKLGNIFDYSFTNRQLWLSWYSLFLKAIFEGFDRIKLSCGNNNLLTMSIYANNLIDEISTKNLPRYSVSTMCNLRVKAPGAETDYGSVIIFSDVVFSTSLIEFIQSLVWPIFVFMRQMETHVFGELNLYSHGLRAAISSIMSRNASHNIGSHVLSRIATKGIDGWTENKKVWEILDEVSGKISEEENTRIITTQQIQTSRQKATNLVHWSKNVQYLARYIQQRMDFIALISTDWPDWSEPAYLLKDLLRWFLHQKHLLNYIATSENLGATLFDEESGIALPTPPEGMEGGIRLHVFMAPKSLWRTTHSRDSDNIEDRLKTRRAKIAEHCKKEQMPCRFPQEKAPCADCRCVLLEMPNNENPIVNYKHDLPLAIPGGLVGYHSFYVILENIIRNAAKHGFARRNGNKTPHLDIVIEVLFDPEESIGIYKQDRKAPAYLIRIYDNVSLVAPSTRKGKEQKEASLWGEKGMNTKLGTSIIDDTGQLRKEDWGLAEMKIAAGYLQRREVLHIGGEDEKIVGKTEQRLANLPNGERGLDIEMLEQRLSQNWDKGAEAVIRAVESPIGTLGYEFFIPKPRIVGIVCGEKKAAQP